MEKCIQKFNKIVNLINSILFSRKNSTGILTMVDDKLESSNTNPDWRKQEITCFNYLNDKFSDYADFELRGGADSDVSDIYVSTENNSGFYIDSKKENSQCSQFVVVFDENENKYKYSDRDRLEADENSLKIVEYMNENKEQFKTAGTRGMKIEFEDSNKVFRDYLTDSLHKKNIRFIISKDNILIPVENIDDYFDIKCCYRKKKSGSRNIPKKNYKTVCDYLIENKIDYKTIDNKIYVKGLDKGYKFNINNDVYYVSTPESNGFAKVRILSKTANSNVIFTLKLKKNRSGITDEEFIEYLKAN